jgi:hypothetical protein
MAFFCSLIERRIIIAQSLYALGMVLCIVSTF